MKTSNNWIIGVLLILLPLTASAQKNIQSAFKAIIQCPQAQIKETSTLDKDNKNIKTGESSVYNFRLPSNKKNLIKAAMTAFEKDKDSSYSFKVGTGRHNDSPLTVGIGDGKGTGIRVNNEGYDYLYALFLAPKSEDPEGNHRYSYSITYKEEKGDIVGKIVITYATTLMYRQQLEREKMRKKQQNFTGNNNTNSQSNSQNWFNDIMSCFQSMNEAGPQTRIKLATKAYNLINNISKYPEVTITDKNTVREILKGLIQDKEYSETVLNKLLNQCYNNLR